MAALALAALGGAANAQDCPRGTLDARFFDPDGELVADTPTDPLQLIDPDTLIFVDTPVEDAAVYKTAWSGFLTHLEKEPGKTVVFFPFQNNAAQIVAMRSGRLHIAGFDTGSNPLAVNCAGFKPFAIIAAADGSFGYEMEKITCPGSGIEKVEDIKGKQQAITSPTSNSGFKAPSAIPTTGLDTAYILTTKLQDKIRNVFFSFEWAGTTLETEFGKAGESQFIKMNDKDFWEVIRKIDTTNEVPYARE